MSQSTLREKTLPRIALAVRQKILNLLEHCRNVALTTDIWTDRTMRSYLGVTAHFIGINPKTNQNGLQSVLLTCRQFDGRHAGSNIAQTFEEVVETFNLTGKVCSQFLACLYKTLSCINKMYFMLLLLIRNIRTICYHALKFYSILDVGAKFPVKTRSLPVIDNGDKT